MSQIEQVARALDRLTYREMMLMCGELAGRIRTAADADDAFDFTKAADIAELLHDWTQALLKPAPELPTAE